MPFPLFSVPGLLVIAWLLLKHNPWIEAGLGPRVAGCVALAATLVLCSGAQSRPADFRKVTTWAIERSMQEAQPMIDQMVKTIIPTTTTTTVATATKPGSR